MKPVSIRKINQSLLMAVLIGFILYMGREIFVLVTFSIFLAMLMTPVSNKLESMHVPRILSSLVSVLIIVIVIILIFMLLSAQIASVSHQLPQIKSRITEITSSTEEWIKNQFGVSPDQQVTTLKEQASKAISSIGSIFTGMIKGTVSLVAGSLLMLIFMFLFLLNREKYENFIIMFYKDERQNEARYLIGKISKIAQKYLAGRLISIFLLAILYIIGFYAIGLKNAILLSAIAAVVSFIPYVGTFIGALVPFFMAIIQGSFHLAVWVIIVVSLAHVFQNYIIEPYFVGGSVNISPFFTILILILGGVFWGIAGIILFLPLLGIVKIICENVESLYPFAYLIGTERNSSSHGHLWSKLKGIFRK
jgi:predicted PurR-regulated permease PerM